MPGAAEAESLMQPEVRGDGGPRNAQARTLGHRQHPVRWQRLWNVARI